MEHDNEHIMDYLILKIVEDLINNKKIENDILNDCYNHSFIDRAREIIPRKFKKKVFLDKIISFPLSKNESNILFNILQAYDLNNIELNSIKDKLLNSVSGLFAYFSFDKELENKDFINGLKFIESNWDDFKIEELRYEDPKNVKFEKTKQTIINRINKANINKKWLYLFSNKAFEEHYNRLFLDNNFKLEIINLYNNHLAFYKRLKLKFLK